VFVDDGGGGDDDDAGLCDYVTTLHELNLSRNQISYIPPAITNLTNLRLLYLGVPTTAHPPPPTTHHPPPPAAHRSPRDRSTTRSIRSR
jgi:hypothetical protein